MKIRKAAILLTFILSSSPLWAESDIFVKITPSVEAKGDHTKVKLEKLKDGKFLLTLSRISGLKAWLVVCNKAGGKDTPNFRYAINWKTSSARKKGIELVVPIDFVEGMASLQITDDIASRSYIVYGGIFKDGKFYTVDVPAFKNDLVRKGE